MTGAPAYLRNARMDVFAANALGFALYTGVLSRQTLPVNLAGYLFLDPRATEFFVGWEKIVNDAVAALRTEAGRIPYDRALSDLVGELSTRSDRSVSAGPSTTYGCIAPQ
jgi:hypothetical protein